VFRTQEGPSGLSVSGLTSTVTEGTLTPFTITVRVPGVDNKAAQKPRLVVSYDGVSYTAGNTFLELDASRYVVSDLNQKDAEYLGDFKWKFALIFDTKNISVQPQLAKDGTILASADGSRVRVSFKAYSPNGMSTPEHLVQIKISYNKPVAAPRFDVSGLGQQGLEAIPGQTVTLKFSVSSPDTTAEVKVETKSSTLAGKPEVSCKAATSSKQECVLNWTVPCDASASSLTGSINMTATSTVNGRISEITPYSLKVVKSSKENLCGKATGGN
jgi:hypothetical protein